MCNNNNNNNDHNNNPTKSRSGAILVFLGAKTKNEFLRGKAREGRAQIHREFSATFRVACCCVLSEASNVDIFAQGRRGLRWHRPRRGSVVANFPRYHPPCSLFSWRVHVVPPLPSDLFCPKRRERDRDSRGTVDARLCAGAKRIARGIASVVSEKAAFSKQEDQGTRIFLWENARGKGADPA